MSRRNVASYLVLALVVILSVLGYLSSTQDTTTKPGSDTPVAFTLTADQVATAKQELAELTVAEVPADLPKYQREEQFGRAWTDKAMGVNLAGNGCDTRNDILARDMVNITKEGDCTVTSGTLPIDPYTGEKNVAWTRGKKTSSAIQIDHVVALEDVWRSGGYKMEQDTRVAIANDPINLVAADGPTNGAKGSKSADQWVPPFDKVHCYYAASQIQVKHKYGLSVTQPEHDALEKYISTCNV